MRIVVITQEDAFFIPRNVALLCAEPGMEVAEIVVLDARGALVNMRRRFLRWFGVVSAARMLVKTMLGWVQSRLDVFTGGNRAPASLRAVARLYGARFSSERSANAPEVVQRLRGQAPDIIVSFSAPEVFGEELLGLPRLGCINLHCSLLPHYRGLLPSFWVLHNGEKRSGATVHYMAAGIDDGDILAQREVDISTCRTMFQVLTATKAAGGELMLEAVRALRDGSIAPRPNRLEEGSYYTWPSDDDVKRFHDRGLRLV
jgi:methionyl-tRNA formyltransferase